MSEHHFNVLRSTQPQPGLSWTIEFLNRIMEKSILQQHSFPCNLSSSRFNYSRNASKNNKSLASCLQALTPIVKRAIRMVSFATDGNGGQSKLLALKVFEDNVLVREFLRRNGRVLVVDGGGSLRCAILGGNPGVQTLNNGWVGKVVNGCTRDVDEIYDCDIGVRALAPHPVRANKKRIGEKHEFDQNS
ncbi:unnamed protein product [Fraxinus pennsylvanica]|uniref:4-hydroxy-4-methyl-2-oxoglutarate aldolase n=1 Tax=Fraxinus pennsylvanica TaxID=56036 RepID=A0AAD1Z8E7_9LAMI|nr:unnamed protein product [Fraxinus pennsylvanica]